MYDMKKHMIAIGIMIIVSMISLLVISAFTYIFKWQADKAMIGIIITYVLAGFSCGVYLRNRSQIGHRRKLIEALEIGTAYMLLLLLLSCFVVKIPFEFSVNFLLIWMLVSCSIFVGTQTKSHS